MKVNLANGSLDNGLASAQVVDDFGQVSNYAYVNVSLS